MSAKRKIAIDARHLHSGIGTYAVNVLSRIQGLAKDFDLVALTQQQYKLRMADMPWCQVRTISGPLYSLKSQISIQVAASDCDLLQMTNYDLPLLRMNKTVATIHDVTHLDRAFVPNAAALLYAKFMLRACARKATRIITVSEFSKGQIVEHLDAPPEKVTVAHCGVDPHFSPRSKDEAAEIVAATLGIRKPYLLYVSNLKPHKNLRTLLAAYACLRERGVSHQLVIVGDDKIGAQTLKADSLRLGIHNSICWLPSANYAVLPHLYSCAEVFILPSLTEGFGLPVLEAMACGTPVVCSRAASLPEVAGVAAEYFDPLSSSDLVAVLDRVLSNPDLREQMRHAGLKRSQLFSWQDCADKHAQVYRQVLCG